MSTIRVEKNKDNPYVSINKTGINDPALSFKAKGILAYLLSKPDGWKCIVKDLKKHAKDGEDSIYSGLKELRAAGYIIKRPVKNEKGIIVEWEEIIYETPREEAKEIYEKQKRATKTPLRENPDMDENPLRENPDMDNPDVVLPDVEKPEILISNEKLNKDKVNNEGIKKEVSLPELLTHIEELIKGVLTLDKIEYIQDYWCDKLTAGEIFEIISRYKISCFKNIEDALIKEYVKYKK